MSDSPYVVRRPSWSDTRGRLVDHDESAYRDSACARTPEDLFALSELPRSNKSPFGEMRKVNGYG